MKNWCSRFEILNPKIDAAGVCPYSSEPSVTLDPIPAEYHDFATKAEKITALLNHASKSEAFV